MKLRKSVHQFAQLMEKRLQLNDYKGGWQNESDSYLFQCLIEELVELCRAQSAQQKCNEAADAANFAMMIADNSKWGKR